METKKSYFFHITIAQIICMILIFGYILSVKFVFKGTYKEFKNWYNEEICQDTDIKEVLK